MWPPDTEATLTMWDHHTRRRPPPPSRRPRPATAGPARRRERVRQPDTLPFGRLFDIAPHAHYSTGPEPFARSLSNTALSNKTKQMGLAAAFRGMLMRPQTAPRERTSAGPGGPASLDRLLQDQLQDRAISATTTADSSHGSDARGEAEEGEKRGQGIDQLLGRRKLTCTSGKVIAGEDINSDEELAAATNDGEVRLASNSAAGAGEDEEHGEHSQDRRPGTGENNGEEARQRTTPSHAFSEDSDEETRRRHGRRAPHSGTPPAARGRGVAQGHAGARDGRVRDLGACPADGRG